VRGFLKLSFKSLGPAIDGVSAEFLGRVFDSSLFGSSQPLLIFRFSKNLAIWLQALSRCSF
jgi:hypothetical protein